MKEKPFNLILLGDPASGKGTQAERLTRRYRLYNFDMGKEVLKPAALKLYDYAHTTGIGHLTPTHVVRNILRRVIGTMPLGRGILFNGHPKMIGEAKLVASWLKRYKRADPLVIYLALSTEETLRRAKKRRIYKNGKLVKRDDDSKRAIQNRREYYREQVARVVVFFKKRYAFKKISGLGSEAAVWKRIDAAVREHLKIENNGH